MNLNSKVKQIHLFSADDEANVHTIIIIFFLFPLHFYHPWELVSSHKRRIQCRAQFIANNIFYFDSMRTSFAERALRLFMSSARAKGLCHKSAILIAESKVLFSAVVLFLFGCENEMKITKKKVLRKLCRHCSEP